MSTEQFTQEQQDIIAKVEKLLRLAAKNPNENEAAAASAKAAELLAAYNLESAEIDITGESSGKRAQENMVGGFYQFERDVWRSVAELNFCWYWTHTKRVLEGDPMYGHRRWTHVHVLVGKVVNIAATKAMAGYLMQAVERITREEMKVYLIEHPRSSWAVSFRRGVAERVIEKVTKRRWDLLEAEQKKAAEAAERAREAGVSSVETSLTLKGVQDAEYAANYDFLYGKGKYAEVLAERARRAKAREEAEAQYTAWAAAHPEEAAKAERERIAKARRSHGGRVSYGSTFKGDWSAYSKGREAGKNIGIDPQAGDGRSRGSLKSGG